MLFCWENFSELLCNFLRNYAKISIARALSAPDILITLLRVITNSYGNKFSPDSLNILARSNVTVIIARTRIPRSQIYLDLNSIVRSSFYTLRNYEIEKVDILHIRSSYRILRNEEVRFIQKDITRITTFSRALAQTILIHRISLRIKAACRCLDCSV